MHARNAAVLTGLVLALPTLSGCPVRPVTINAGIGFFEVLEADTPKDVTGPQQVLIEATILEITATRVPADLFDPGSDPLETTVTLVGDPLLTTPLVGTNIGATDTLLTILDDMELPAIDSQATASAELSQSRLRATGPVIVTYEGGQNPETWELGIDFEFDLQSPGTINVTRTGRNEGTIEGSLPVAAKLMFVRESDSAMREVMLSDTLVMQPANWTIEPDELNWPVMYRTNMVPALSRVPAIGRLFRRSQAELRGNELLIFITPTIIVDEE